MDTRTSEFQLPLTTPVRIGRANYSLSTEDHARVAFYSHERRIREDGRAVVETNRDRIFEWKPSPSFGPPLKRRVMGEHPKMFPTIVTHSLRTEFIMITYAYVIRTLGMVVEEFRAFMARKSHSRNNHDDQSEIRDMAKRLYTIYVITNTVLKPHIRLCTKRRTAPPCAELSVYTAEALMHIILAFHTIVLYTSLEMVKEKDMRAKRAQRQGDGTFAPHTSAKICMFISSRFNHAYTILTKKVWTFYTPGTEDRTLLQQYLLGSGQFYLAKAYMYEYEQEKSVTPSPRHSIMLALLRRAEFLVRLTSDGSALGFHESSTIIKRYIVSEVAEIEGKWQVPDVLGKRFETPEDFDAVARYVSTAITEDDGKHLLKTHEKRYGKSFVSDPQYCTLTNAILFTGSNQ